MDFIKVKNKDEFDKCWNKKCEDFFKSKRIGYYIAGFPTPDLYKGVNCTHMLECCSSEVSFISSSYYAMQKDGELNNNDQIALFNTNGTEFGICSKDMYIWVDYLWQTIHVKEMTPDGVYELLLSAKKEFNEHLNRLSFHSNADILKYAIDAGFTGEQAKSIFDIIKFKFAHDNSYLKVSFPYALGNLPQPILNISDERPTKEFTYLANKLYRKGLIYVEELTKNGGSLEIDDRDIRFFEEVSKDELNISDSSNVMENDSTSNSENLDSARKIDDDSSIDLDQFIKSLKRLSSVGVELTDEQKNLLNAYERLIGKLNSEKFMKYYNKLISEEFRIYKDSSARREGRLKEIYEQNARADAERNEWYESEDNPSNIRKKQIDLMNEQLSALNNVRQFMPLHDSQEKSRRELETFFDMKEIADGEDHTLDTTMSGEIRDWYKNEYGSQDGVGKTR